MKSPKPLKRHDALQPLSREHHHGLLLSWKIRAGLKGKVEIGRIKQYCDVFFEQQLQPHFEIEEKYVFPILGNDHELAKKGIEHHRKLENLFKTTPATEETVTNIADLLDEHIRFEERKLFEAIQQEANKEQLQKIAEVHPEQTPACKAIEDWEDEFWIH